jgi:DNA-binding transcriptional regulator/RsmH inhibitor MraZ
VRRKNRELGSQGIAVDAQGRVCLTPGNLSTIGANKGGHVDAVVDQWHTIRVFSDEKALRRFIRSIPPKISTISPADVEFYIYSQRTRLQIDPRGRITLPSNIREEAGLEDVAVVLAMTDHLAIMAPTEWRNQMQRIQVQLRGLGHSGR